MDQSRPTGGKQLTKADIKFAVNLLNKGASPEEVQGKLVERGIDQATATAAVRDLLIRAHAQARAEKVEGRRQLRQLLGAFVFIIGIGLFLGNVTGRFPTFALAGFMVMCVGGIIYKGRKR